MVEFIRGNPVLSAYQKGQAAYAKETAFDAQTAVADQKREDSEVARINADNLDRRIAKAATPPASPQPQAQAQPAIQRQTGIPRVPARAVPVADVGGAPGPVRSTMGPQVQPATPAVPSPAVAAAPAPVNQNAAPASAPAAGLRSVTPGTSTPRKSPEYVRAKAMLESPGYRDQGLQLMEQLREKESAQLQKMIEIASKSPEMAVAYAQQEGLNVPPPMMEALRMEWFRNWWGMTEKQLATTYKGDPVGYGEAAKMVFNNLIRATDGWWRQGGNTPFQIPGFPAGLPVPNPQQKGRPVQVQTEQGPVWTSPQEAVGQPAPPKGSGITPTREAINIEIEQDREYLQGLFDMMPSGTTLRDEIKRLSRETTDTGRINPDYDPDIQRAYRKAWRRKVGGDSGFDAFRQMLNVPKPAAPQAAQVNPPPEQPAPPQQQSALPNLIGSAQAAEPAPVQIPAPVPPQPSSQEWTIIEGRRVRQIGTFQGAPVYQDETGARFTAAPTGTL